MSDTLNIITQNDTLYFTVNANGTIEIKQGENVNLARAERIAAEAAAELSEAWAEGTEPGGSGTKSSKEHAEDAAATLIDVNAAADQVFAFVPEEVFVATFEGDATALFFAPQAQTVTELATVGTGTVTYEKSTAAAPGTFASTTSPIELEAGAWLRIIATSVTGPFGVSMFRSTNQQQALYASLAASNPGTYTEAASWAAGEADAGIAAGEIFIVYDDTNGWGWLYRKGVSADGYPLFTLPPQGQLGEWLWRSGDQSANLTLRTIAGATVSGNNFTLAGHGVRHGDALVSRVAVNGLSANTIYYGTNYFPNPSGGNPDVFSVSATPTNAYIGIGGTKVALSATTATTFYLLADPTQTMWKPLPGRDLTGLTGAWQYMGDTVRVTPERFGYDPDNTADENWAAMLGMAAWGRKQGILEVTAQVADRIYNHYTPSFLAGIPYLRVGPITVRNRLAGLNGGIAVQHSHNNVALGAGHPFWTSGHGLTDGTPSNGSLIATVKQGSYELVTEDSSDWGDNFVVGKRVLVYGHCRQFENSMPPNVTKFEYHRIVAKAGDTLTLENPLAYSYEEEWPDLGVMSSTGMPYGAPRCLSLHADGLDLFTESAVYTDVTCLPDDTWTDVNATASRNGRMLLRASMRNHGIGCKASSLYTSVSESIRYEHFDITHEIETDKIINYMVFDMGKAYAHLEGGATHLTLRNVSLTGLQSIGSIESLVLDKCYLAGYSAVGNGYALALKFSATNFELRDNVFEMNDQFPDTYTATFTVNSQTQLQLSEADHLASGLATNVSTGASTTFFRNAPMFNSDGVLMALGNGNLTVVDGTFDGSGNVTFPVIAERPLGATETLHIPVFNRTILQLPATYSASYTVNSDSELQLTEAAYIASEVGSAWNVGRKLYDSTNKLAALVTGMPRSDGAGNVLLPVKLVQDLASPTTLYMALIEGIKESGSHYRGDYGRFTEFWPNTSNAQRNAVIDLRSDRFGDDYIEFKSSDMPNSLAVRYPQFGSLFAIDRIVLWVTQARAVAGVLDIDTLFPSVEQIALLNLEAVGRRVIDVSGNYGAQTGDTLTGLPTIPVSAIRLQASGSPGVVVDSHDRGVWTLRFYGRRVL
jgi:hypothetical protein